MIFYSFLRKRKILGNFEIVRILPARGPRVVSSDLPPEIYDKGEREAAC
jgi:hypothetical protein